MAPKYFNKNVLQPDRIYTVSSSVEKKVNEDYDKSKGVSNNVRDVYDADFETAVSATKFGKFNICLFLVSIPAGWTNMFETTTMSYVFPAAHCDLDLSLNDRGSLNAITFVGMITSGFMWGFLCDTFGRKKLMVTGYLLDAVFVIMSSFSQNYTLILIFKFFGGFIINGPFTALTAYLSEFHCSSIRSRVQLIRGTIVTCGTMALPLLAMAILPQDINFNLFNGAIVLRSWNIFLLVCAIPSLVSGLIFIFMPESPKFLMTNKRNDEALAVFQKVFSFNTGKSKDEFPIKSVLDESFVENDKSQAKPKFKRALNQVKPLCLPPYVKNIILVCAMQSIYMLAVNTLRLWLPQIFQSISDYQYYNNGTTGSLCTMLETLTPSNQTTTTCHVNFSTSVYLNTITIAGVTLLGYVIAGSLINKLGKKILLAILSIFGGVSAMAIYFSQNTAVVITLSSLFLSMGSVCGNIILTIVIDVFPTSLRALAISLVLMFGRAASMAGNLIFPLLLALGCAPPFFAIGAVVIGCSLLIVLLPNTELKALQ